MSQAYYGLQLYIIYIRQICAVVYKVKKMEKDCRKSFVEKCLKFIYNVLYVGGAT